ncbi:MAG: ABC transporter substrate-binding protein [Ruminococcaceae bacterium]|jgi:ABC-type transport system substrate-binding protein|nr:ABC transporter substrate-binding protein [Oscillospiraceae bacterium]
MNSEEKIMKRKQLLAILLMLCMLLTACGETAQEQKPTGADLVTPQGTQTQPEDNGGDASRLVIAIPDEMVGLDVQQISWENMVHDLIFEPLVVYSADLSEIYPSFAESFTATGAYLEFVLPEGAKFSNGDPLDAQAVKASTDRFLAISEYAGDLEPVKSVVVIDERTVRYNLHAPAPYIWANIASLYGGIVDTAVAEKIGDWEFNRKPVGNGMYYVEDWELGDHITLKRNEYFHTANPMLKNHDAPPFETIEVRFIPDAEERVAALEAGEVDLIYNTPVDRMPELEASGKYSLYSYLQPGISYLNLQTGKGILSNKNVREALTYAVDRDAINAALGGHVTPTYGFLSAAQAGYSAKEEAKLASEYKYDPERAKALLESQGWVDGDGDGVRDRGGARLKLELLIPSDNSSLRAAGPVLQEQFAAVGVETELVEYEADYIKELMREDEYEIGSRALKWVDADILIYAFGGESGYPWEDPALTKLILAARYKNDPAERIEAYEEVSEQLAQDFKAISLFADNYIITMRSDIEGVVITNDGRVWFSDTVVKNG